MSIKQKLITILLCAGLIPTFAVGVVAYVTISNQLHATAASQLSSISIKQQETINTLLQDKQEQVAQLANEYNLQAALAGYTSQKDSSELATINSAIQAEQVADPTNIQDISVASPSGKIFASTLDGSTGQQLPSQSISLLDSGNANAITVSQDPSDGIDKLHITTTITVNGQEAAVLDVTWTLEDIVAAIQDYTGLGQTGETVIAAQNSKGEAISLFPLRFDTNAALTTNLSSLHLFANNASTYSNVKDYRGHEVTVSARPVGFANWVIATKMDNQEINAPINKLRDSLIVIDLCSLAVITIIAWYLAMIFTQPILRIARTAGLIGQGDLSARTDVAQNDEIGKLGSSINAMGQNLSGLVTRIEAQRNQLQVILDSTLESIVAIDKSGSIIIANQGAADLTLQPSSSLVKRHVSEIFHWTKDGQEFPMRYDLPGTHIYTDLQYIVPPNSPHFVKVIVSQVNGAYGQTDAQTIVTIHDETRSRELEAMKVDFVSMAAHELRTPLAAIRGYLELVRYKEATNLANGGKAYVEQALKSTTELGGLINNLLDVTRIERGTLTLHMEAIDLAASAAHAVQDARFVAQDRHQELTYEGAQQGYQVVGDEVALREIINNLITNAIKYTPENGKIRVSFSEQEDKYMVSVKDTGYGIPKAALPNLFTKFYRVHGGLDSGSTGTGLGLFISKSIAERHGGTITVQSQEGAGSTFTFVIPKLTPERLAAAQEQTRSQDMLMRRHRGWVTQNITR